MSLPPELGEIDDGWGADEQPTIARPSRAPTAPVRPVIPIIPVGGEAPLPPLDPSLRPDLAEEGEDLQERVTTVPDIPADEYARQMMAAPQEAVTEAPPVDPAQAVTDAAGLSLDPTGETTSVSDVPTAPPPGSFETPSLSNLPPASNLGVKLESKPPVENADKAPPLSQPRMDAVPFSGRYDSDPAGPSVEQTMKDKFAMGDFSGALEIAEGVLKTSPSDQEADSLARKCREVLHDMYASRIADMQRVPSIIMSPDQIRWLSLDHRAGFLLSMIDGVSSVDDLLDVSGMQRLDALRILCGLLDQKVISLT